MKRLVVLFLVALGASASAQPVPPPGLRKITHDTTLTGAGTLASALGLAPCGSVGQTWIWNGSAFACGSSGGSGSVTNVSTLAPLQGGPITTTGTVSLINCSANQIYKMNGGGTAWACGADSDTTYSGASGITLGGTTFSLDSSFSATFGGLTDTGLLVMSGAISPTALSGTQADNYAPAGGSTASAILQDASSATTITGLSIGQVSGREVTFTNISTTSAVLLLGDDGATSTATNRFLFEYGGNCALPPYSSIVLRYDGSRFRAKTACPAPTVTAHPSATITVTDTGTQNDYTPAGIATAGTIFFNNASTLTINGLAGGRDGRVLNICAINTAAVTLVNEVTAGNTAANRFNFPSAASATLAGGGTNKISCGQLLYLAGSVNRWTELSLTASPSQTLPYTYSQAISANAGLNVQGSTSLTGNANIRCSSVSAAPVATSCGTGATITSCPTSFTVTTGTGATGCTITFTSIWGGSHAACTVQPEGGAAAPAITYTGTTVLTFGAGTAASTAYDVHCIGTN